MKTLALLAFCLAYSLAAASERSISPIKSVVGELVAAEGKVSAPMPNRERECIDLNLRTVRRFVYEIGGELPKVNQYKAKLFQEREKDLMEIDSLQKERVFAELASDPEWYLWKAHQAVRQAAERIEKLPDAATALEKARRLKVGRTKQPPRERVDATLQKILEQSQDQFYRREQLEHLHESVKALDDIHNLIYTMESLDKSFQGTGRAQELSKITGNVKKWSASRFHIPFTMVVLHGCYTELLIQ